MRLPGSETSRSLRLRQGVVLLVGTIGMLLARRGFAVDPLGMAITIAVGGTVLTFEESFSSVVGDARFYALLIGAVGLVNLLIGAFADDHLPGSHRAPVGP